MTRRRKVVLTLVFGVAALVAATVAIRKKSGDAQALAIRAAQSVGAEGAEDLLRYTSRCRDAADIWILSSQGADALWEKQCDQKGHFRLWFRADERAKGFRVLRQLTYGPAPKDDEFHWLIEKIRDQTPTAKNFNALVTFGRLNNASHQQRLWAEQTLKPLAKSPESEDRIFYAARAEWSNTAIANETLESLLDDTDPLVVAQAISSMGFRDPKRLKPRMLTFLESNNPNIRQAAWRIVSFRDSREIQERVRKGLWSAIATDRESAIVSMTYQPPPPDARIDTRSRAVARYGTRGSNLCNPCTGKMERFGIVPIMEPATHDLDVGVRTMAVSALGQNKVRSVLPMARAWLRSQNEHERRAGLLAVWRLNDRASLPEIEKLENDPSLQYLVPEILQQWRPKNKAVDLFQKTFQLPFGQ